MKSTTFIFILVLQLAVVVVLANNGESISKRWGSKKVTTTKIPTTTTTTTKAIITTGKKNAKSSPTTEAVKPTSTTTTKRPQPKLGSNRIENSKIELTSSLEDLINELRASLSSGKLDGQIPKSPLGNLSYDSVLTNRAKQFVANCKLEHVQFTENEAYGDFVIRSSGIPSQYKDKKCDKEASGRYPCKSFYQTMSRDAKKIGCASQECFKDGNSILTCCIFDYRQPLDRNPY